MILTDDMLALAFQYRDTELWNILADSDVFAFRLSDGETGYCCVMGNGGEHLALGFYRGRKGFTSYLKSLSFDSMQLSEMDMLEMAATSTASIVTLCRHLPCRIKRRRLSATMPMLMD